MKDIFSKRQRFSLRKLTIGVCSVLLGTTIFATNAVAAEEVSATAAEATTTAAAPATTAEATTEAETTAAPAATEETTAAPAATEETTVAPEAAAETTAAPAAAEETTTAAPAAGETSRTRSRRAASQGSDNSPVDVETTLKDGETVTPDMSNPNGANVKSRDISDASYKKATSGYTFHVVDLTRFNERYGVNYYVRASKPFDTSEEVTLELVDKNTNTVLETKKLNKTSGDVSFQKTAQASNSQMTLVGVFTEGKGAVNSTAPFIQYHYDIDPVIKSYENKSGDTPEDRAKKKLFSDVMNSRTSTDIFNAVEPAYEGRTITDTNGKIPTVVDNATYYRVVDKSNPTYQAGRTETATQSYKPNGNEVELASYTLKAMEGQNFNASGERQFEGYRLYQTIDPDATTGVVSRPYVVGTKFMDADRFGIKRIKEVVGEDGSVVVRVYLLDPKQQSKRSDGTLSTDGYMLIAETKPIKPGSNNTEELAYVKSPLTTIPLKNYPNGKEVNFGFQTAAGYTPYKTVFVPFLGDGIGHNSSNQQLEDGVGGIGINVDLLNSLAPYKPRVYYYEKIEPVKVKPEFKKSLEGRNLVDGEFSFTIKEQKSSPDGHEETVQNADGKVSFSELTFNKPGTYKYKITEKAGSDANVDYDAMEITMTVEVTQDAAGVLKTKVTYSAEGGETSKADDQEFNNFVVPPVTTKFDFTKKLEGRPLKDKEFSFVLKDAEGNEIETVKNDADGNVTFTALNYDKTKVGVHKYTVEEVIPATKEDRMDYDTMKANITVTVSKSGHVLTTVTTYASEGGKATGADDKEFNNKVTPPPTTPEFKPEKFVVNKEKFDITGDKLMDDDNELTDEVAETNANPYADKSTNNEPENINGKTLKKGDKFYYQVWLDTTKFTADQNIQYVGITDDYEEDKLDVTTDGIKVYDSVSGADVTDKFDITVEDGVVKATSKASLQKSLGDAENTQVLDTTKFAFGRYYKFDIVATVKEDVTPGADIENTAVQVVNQYDPTSKTVKTPEKPTQKRVVNIPVEVEFNFTKKLQGRELKEEEFSFVLKDAEGTEIETVKNDKDGNVKFKALAFNKNQAGTYKYTIEEVAGSDATVTYDKMKAEVTVEVSYDGDAKVLVTKLTDAPDKEFNNVVTPPDAPNFKPEKFILSEEKYDITGDKLMDDDDELTDEVADTNANPYADKTTNNEAENLNTKTVKRGSKVVYQVWLDTNNFTEKQNIQSVGITDDYDEAKLTVDAANVKAYDSKTGADVTDLFDITVNNGVITATSKASLQKSLGDAEDTQVLDTTKFAFGRYYKFDIVATVKEDVTGGADIENTATQIVHQYDPTSKSVVTPEKPTQKRVINVPIEVEFNFTKKLEGRELKENEFTFVLKDAKGTEIETVKNDVDGNVKFKAIEYNKDQAGTYKYTIEEVAGTDGTVTYDKMKAEVTVEVKYDGTAKALITKVTDAPDKEFNNTVTPPETPEFQPKKFVVKDEKFDITGDKLADDDKELTDAVTETNADPYADTTDNNEAENLNTKTVKRGDKLVYQVWLDTNNFTEKQNIQSVGITDDYDEAKLTVEAANVKAYDSKTGADVTDLFDITVEDGVIKATSKASLQKSLGDAEDTQVLDTEKFAFGRYYKFDIVATVKEDVAGGSQIENTATQIVHQYDPTSKTVKTPEKPTEKRVNQVPIEVEFDFTKKLEGRELAAGEFSFVLKDAEGTEIETVKNDKDGKIKFSKIEFKKGDEGTHKYTVEEVAGTDATVTYDTMKAEISVEVSYDGTAKILVTKVTDAADKEFNNTVTPPETPEFQPKKFVVKDEKFDTTGDKLVDDDAELTDAVTDTKADPYADKADNNEAENINTSTLKKGDKVVYQVWLDTTKFDANNKDYIQSVGITDNYDEENLTVDVANIKAYDSVTGEDVTAKFDIKVENGVITATSKADLTKSLGDAEDTKVLDTTKFAFGRYYKFDIVATIKETAKDGVDIENTASQTVHQYDPTKKSVEKPEKPTETRVVNIPTKVEFEFTKRLEGRPLKDGEFSFVLKDKDGNVIETVTNDADGKIKFSALTFKRGEEGVYTYTVEEVKGTEEGVTYDTMVATVTVTVAKDGKVLTAVAGLPEDTEFNNTVTPPNTPNTPPQTPPTPGKPELPKTGVEDLSAVFNAASMSLLAGLGLLATGKKKEDEEE